MTKDKAIEAMKKGLKVRHYYFGDNEFIYMDAGMIVTEEGYKVKPIEFWAYRSTKGWQNGWSIIKTPLPGLKL